MQLTLAESTPMHRVQLPGTANRSTANRSQFPLGTSRPNFLAGSHNPQGSSVRNNIKNAGSANSYGMGNLNGYGISAGIKVGRVGSSGLNSVEPRAEHCGGKQKELSEDIRFLTSNRTFQR